MTDPAAGSHDDENAPPPDPMTQLAAVAVQMHEAYSSYVLAGFTEGQALTLVAAILAAVIHNQNGGTA
jgi:hypothetical protein